MDSKITEGIYIPLKERFELLRETSEGTPDNSELCEMSRVMIEIAKILLLMDGQYLANEVKVEI